MQKKRRGRRGGRKRGRVGDSGDGKLSSTNSHVLLLLRSSLLLALVAPEMPILFGIRVFYQAPNPDQAPTPAFSLETKFCHLAQVPLFSVCHFLLIAFDIPNSCEDLTSTSSGVNAPEASSALPRLAGFHATVNSVGSSGVLAGWRTTGGGTRVSDKESSMVFRTN